MNVKPDRSNSIYYVYMQQSVKWDKIKCIKGVITAMIVVMTVCLCAVLCFSGPGDDNSYPLHTENCSDLFGPNYIKELSDWSTHQQPLMP